MRDETTTSQCIKVALYETQESRDTRRNYDEAMHRTGLTRLAKVEMLGETINQCIEVAMYETQERKDARRIYDESMHCSGPVRD